MERDSALISAALGMGKQANGLDLAAFLVNTCASLHTEMKVTVLEVQGLPRSTDAGAWVCMEDLSIRRFDDTTPRPKWLDMSGLRETLQKRTAQAVENNEGQSRLLAPLFSNVGPARVLVFDNVEESPLTRTRLLQVVELFANQMRLLDSRERDPLTGLLNRQTFTHYFERTSRQAREAEGHMWLAVLDIDHFKKVNDTYGHLYGDEVLLQFAQVMERCFRHTDPLFRFGGEEFIVLLHGTDPEAPRIALERFRQTIMDNHFPGVGQVTVSIGYAMCQPNQLPTTVTDRADKALYFAKENGRNRVVDYSNLDHQEDDSDQVSDVQLF